MGISSIVIFLTYILGPSRFVELFRILLFLAFSFSLYEILRVGVLKIKKTSGIAKENNVVTAAILEKSVRVQKWMVIIPWLVISVPTFRSIFLYLTFFNPYR